MLEMRHWAALPLADVGALASFERPSYGAAMGWHEQGLTAVTTKDLETLLRVVFKKQIEAPLAVEGLARAGLQHCALQLLGHLRGFDERAVRGIVTAVLAERALVEEDQLN